jgi:HAT1-interacting factor 1
VDGSISIRTLCYSGKSRGWKRVAKQREGRKWCTSHRHFHMLHLATFLLHTSTPFVSRTPNTGTASLTKPYTNHTMAETTEPTPVELQRKLDHLKASATQQYSLKNYSAAAEFYSEAAEVQDLINGEMSPENSDLLYQYGRCLYHVGVSKSDVLGGKVASNSNEEPKRKKRKTASTAVAESSAAGAAKGESSMLADALKNGEDKKEEEHSDVIEGKPSSDKPFFQITGDENWTDSEGGDEEDGEDAEGNGDEGEEEEEDDDFAIAYEILDVARVLLGRKLESLAGTATDGESESKEAPEARQIRERLADTHDLQAEIKLENEQFADAVTDAQAALKYKLQLFPQESGMVAEAHYKLAIALDFAALPTPPTEEEEKEKEKESAGAAPKEEPVVNEEMRAQAATEMEKAIASCQLRIQKDQEAGKTAAIADIKSMVGEMKNRLAELRKPVETMASAGPADVPDGADPLRGVLGAMLGASKAEQAKVIQQATSQANDLSGLVKKRKAKAVESEVEGKGKKARVEEEK